MKEENNIPKNIRILESCHIPKDVIFGYPIVTIIGIHEVTIENYRGIIEFTSELIRVLCKIGQIKITGNNLDIQYYTNDEMKIVGTIESINYI